MSLIERAIQKLSSIDEPRSATPPNVSVSQTSGGSIRSEPFPQLITQAFAAKPAGSPLFSDSGPLETIDLGRLRTRGFVVPDGAQSELRSQFRIIKRPLIAKAFKRDGSLAVDERRVMVTSAIAGEGKTFCAINLALSMAVERDCSVMLVDADVARPSIPGILGIGATAGLLDALLDETLDLNTVVRRTNIDKFTILTAGTPHPEATELLASAAMGRLLQRLSTSFPDRVLIFDSPPLLLTTESRVLASHMGQIAMVVAAGSTSQEAVSSALATIQQCNSVNLILNKAPKLSAGKNGNWAYGYGYT